jgi:hypothetical protein
MDGLVLGAARFYPLHCAAHCAIVGQPKMLADLRKTPLAVASNQVERHSPRGDPFTRRWQRPSPSGTCKRDY